MKLKFKKQPFQQNAVLSVVDCFAGQPNDVARFMLDKAVDNADKQQMTLLAEPEFSMDIGFRNKEIKLVDGEVLANIRAVQQRGGLVPSDKLDGKYNLTIEMETGTGKTYTYIKTMFELSRRYGWNKFIVVVPSVAIREGVHKAFQMTEDHFMEEYGKKIRYFIYNSKQLHNIDSFAADAGINAMIINSQAFNAKGKDARRIRMELDEFQSRMPIEVLAQTRPIMIIDEPQSVEGEKTKEGLKDFNPLFTLRYSATHRVGQEYNKVYRLDALDAYNKKLVKKIIVKGITVKGSTSTEGYLYLDSVEVSPDHAPVARIEYETRTGGGIKRTIRKLSAGDDLYQLSGQLEQYKGYRIAEIDGTRNEVRFANALTLAAGELRGDVNELNYRRIQIRETIASHLEKERELHGRGIKVLSLFFIDEVAKYRLYDKGGEALSGDYATLFEDEYKQAVKTAATLFDDEAYIKYLDNIAAKDTHKGYFSIDKNKRFIDGKASGDKESDDVDAYDLIMRDKEKLLSFAEPTRFIFSHSALREGWDNPNVFQICTLKHSDATVRKRQEVGRGLRLCVDQAGNRIDADTPGVDVHEINQLTVVASESYDTFAKQLQSEIAEALSDRPKQADVAFFMNKAVKNAKGQVLVLAAPQATKLYQSFVKKDYVDENNNLTPTYFDAVKAGSVALPEEFHEHKDAILELVATVYSPVKTAGMVEDGRKGNVKELTPNSNFKRKEFQELWQKINRKSAYTVQFDTAELVEKCIAALDAKLTVPDVQFTVTTGALDAIDSKEQLRQGNAFHEESSSSKYVTTLATASIRYDLVGKLMEETRLTRKTTAMILQQVKPLTFAQFRKNPEEFILRAGKIINEEKAATVIQSIAYNLIEGSFDSGIFTINSLNATLGQTAHPLKKHIYDYLVTDSNVEKTFAGKLDISDDVCVFAKLPRKFFIPTPVGDYNPDWAIVFKDQDVKYVYFIAETKGSMSSMELREIEKAKIYCAKQHFAKLSDSRFRYDVVNNYDKLMEIVKG